MQKRINWIGENLEYLKANYSYDRIDELAEHFGVKRTALMQVAHRYGISGGRYLTEEQRKYIEDNAQKSNADLARILGLTTACVRTFRSKHKDISTIIEENYDKLTVSEVGRLCGVCHETVSEGWCDKYGLTFKWIGRYKMIKITDLYKWMQKNPNRWDATKCEYQYFANQKWFIEKRKEDADKMRQERWGKFYKVV